MADVVTQDNEHERPLVQDHDNSALAPQHDDDDNGEDHDVAADLTAGDGDVDMRQGDQGTTDDHQHNDHQEETQHNLTEHYDQPQHDDEHDNNPQDMSALPDDHNTGNTSSLSSKERHSLTLDQRRALRRWAHSQTTRPSHKACIEWFHNQYGQVISQSTISHSLSPKYARLDSDNQFSGSRLRFGNWPDVEKLVLLWHGQVVASGRQPSNEELAEKAKNIFTQLPRYKDETPPEFSPGWIHRFKKRYGLLIRRQRRHGTAPNPAEDIPYLVDSIPRFMNVEPGTSPAAIRDQVLKVVGVEASLAICARVRDEIIRKDGRQHTSQQHSALPHVEHTIIPAVPAPTLDGDISFMDTEDPEIVLQNALRALQQEEADAEAEAAAIREDRAQQEQENQAADGAGGNTTQHLDNGFSAQTSTPISSHQTRGNSATRNFDPALTQDDHLSGLNLTPITTEGSMTATTTGERPVRCPFCVNNRTLRSIKEAVEHLSTHVVI